MFRVQVHAWALLITAIMILSAGCDTPSANLNPDTASAPGPESFQQSISEPWTQFRGPDGKSETSEALPEKWGVDDGILWVQGLPGRGASSPIFVDDQIFVTAYSGYGLSMENPGDPAKLEHHLIALERDSGKPVWMRTVGGTNATQKMNNELVRHGFASSTPATDGENVFAFFGVTGVCAFKNDGTPLWQRNVGISTNHFGSSASPLLYDDLCIINASIESETIYGLNKQTGIAAWKIDGIQDCFSMPVIGKNPAGDDEMIVSSKTEINAYDPASGKRLWTCPGITDYVVSVPIISDGICYLTGGKEKQMMAIQMGDVSDEERVIWKVPKLGSNVSSPVIKDGRLYIFADNGVIQIINAANGKLITRHRTATKKRILASPLLAADKIFMAFEDVGIEVLAADEKAKQVALNTVPENAPLMASLVPVGHRFLFRSDPYICCVGPEKIETRDTKWAQPTDHAVIEIADHYNINPANGRARQYLKSLGPDFDKVVTHLMIPYNSVITEQQTKTGRERIFEAQPQYEALREKLLQLRWEQATAPMDDVAKLSSKWESLEAETLDLDRLSRIKVKDLFSKEQMDKHMADAKAKKSHIKPTKSP